MLISSANKRESLFIYQQILTIAWRAEASDRAKVSVPTSRVLHTHSIGIFHLRHPRYVDACHAVMATIFLCPVETADAVIRGVGTETLAIAPAISSIITIWDVSINGSPACATLSSWGRMWKALGYLVEDAAQCLNGGLLLC